MPKKKTLEECLEKSSKTASLKKREILPNKTNPKCVIKTKDNQIIKRKVSQRILEKKASKISSEKLSRQLSQKSLETFSSKASQKNTKTASKDKSQKNLGMHKTSKESSGKPSIKTPQKSSKRPSRKESQKILEKPSKKEYQNLERPSRKESRCLKKPSSKVRRKSLESKTKSISTLQKNLQTNTKEVVHRLSTFCVICKRKFTSKKMLNDHHTKHHFFRHCPNCPKTFQQTRKYILHLRSHLDDHPYECPICLESFNQKRNLLTHKKIHKNPGKLQCSMCPEVLPHLASLNRHRLSHSGPPYPCDECGAIFSNVPDGTVHSKNHVHRCILCPKEVVAFSSNSDLAYHMYTFHQSDEYDTIKGEAFDDHVSTGAVNLEVDSSSDSMEDSLSISDNESDPDMDSNYQKEAVEPVYTLKRKDKFICFICYDLYPSHELLKAHMKAHKWYPCYECLQFFADAKTFQKHKCDFAKVPSFICTNCNTKTECENCKTNLSKAIVDISDVNLNSVQSIVATFPGMPRFPIMDYCDAAQRNWLINFIQHVKYQKQPLDVTILNHIGAHNTNLEMILKDRRIRCLYPEEYIPYIEDLYSEFQVLSQILCNRINCASEQL